MKKICIIQLAFLLMLFSCNKNTEIYRTVLLEDDFPKERKGDLIIDSIVFVYNYFEVKDDYQKIHVNRISYFNQIRGSGKGLRNESIAYYILLKNDSVYIGCNFEGNDTILFYPYLPQKINETFFFNLSPNGDGRKAYMTLIEDNKADSTKIYNGIDHCIYTRDGVGLLWRFDNKLRLLRMATEDNKTIVECKKIERLKKLPSNCIKPNKKKIDVIKPPMSEDEQYRDIRQFYLRWIESLPPWPEGSDPLDRIN